MNRKQRRSGVKAQSAGSTRTDDPMDLHSAGIEAFRAGRLELAASLIARAIAANGQIPGFHYNLAIVRKAQGKLEDAVASYQRAIALKPDHADAHNNLGNIWKSLDQRDKALASFQCALQVRPGNADTLYNLGILCSEAGDREAAAHHFHQCLEHDPDDSHGVRMLLAHLGLATAPEQTSPAQLQKIYDVRSRFWDGETTYFAPGLVAAALKQYAARDRPEVLDLGCGTGLVGALVRPAAGQLDGIDISPSMLEKAKAKGVYDRLEQADFVPFLSTQRARYDAILAAAVLIHFGDLKPALQAAAQALRGNGLFIFTLFSHADEPGFAVAASDRLARNGCYSHSAGYVERLAPENGFAVRLLGRIVHEHDQDGNPVPGLLVVLGRADEPGRDMP